MSGQDNRYDQADQYYPQYGQAASHPYGSWSDPADAGPSKYHSLPTAPQYGYSDSYAVHHPQYSQRVISPTPAGSSQPGTPQQQPYGYAPEPVRTQPGHDAWYSSQAPPSGPFRYWKPSLTLSDPIVPSHPETFGQASRSFSTAPSPQREGRRDPALNRSAGPSYHRVLELGGSTSSGAYTPPHRRGVSNPAAPSNPDTRTPTRSPVSSRPATPRSAYDDGDRTLDTPPSKRAAFTITLPTPEYIALSEPSSLLPPEEGEPAPRKLLVLDLNGALVYRDKRTADKRRSFPRPYLASFLEYLFLPEPILDNNEFVERPWEVFVWSSAQPGNVKGMVMSSFGEVFTEGVFEDEPKKDRRNREAVGEGRILGVWARDKLGLKPHEYYQKVQTVKDLRVLSEHLITDLPRSNNPTLQSLRFDLTNMVLLDDSPLKGIHQPWNEVLLPEYDRAAFQLSKSAVIGAEDGHAVPKGMDDALLCVIGILEAMRDVSNVPAWIRAGGLTPSLGPDGVPSDSATAALPTPDLQTLPSHDTFLHWHAIPSVRLYWLDKGKAALARKGIALRHGMDPSLLSSPGPSPARSPLNISQASLSTEMRQINRRLSQSTLGEQANTKQSLSIHNPRRGARAYSPSRPAETSPSPGPAEAEATNAAPGVSAEYPITVESSSAPSRSTAESRTEVAPGSKSAPNRLEPIDTWRTFKASDVALFLFDMSERETVPLTPEQRLLLQDAASTMDSIGPEYDRTDVGLSQADREICVDCTLRKGEEEIARKNRETQRIARIFGMGPSEEPRAGRGGRGKMRLSKEEKERAKKELKEKTTLAAAQKRKENGGNGNAQASTQAKGKGKENEVGNSSASNGVDTLLGPARYVPAGTSTVSFAGLDYNKKVSTQIKGIVPSEGYNGPSAPKCILAYNLVTEYRTLFRILVALVQEVSPSWSNLKTIDSIRGAHLQLDKLEYAIRRGRQTDEVKKLLHDIARRPLPGLERIFDKNGVLRPPVEFKVMGSWTAGDGQGAQGGGPEAQAADPAQNAGLDALADAAIEKEALGRSAAESRDKRVHDALWAVETFLKGDRILLDHAGILVLEAERRLAAAGVPLRWEGKPDAKMSRGERRKARAVMQQYADTEDGQPIAVASDKAPGVPAGASARVDGSGGHEGANAGAAAAGGQEGMSELDRWRELAFQDVLIPKGSRGDLTILVIQQILQDLEQTAPYSKPFHLGKATLSDTYKRHVAEIYLRGCQGARRCGAIVNFAMAEAIRLGRLRKQAEDGIPLEPDWDSIDAFGLDESHEDEMQQHGNGPNRQSESGEHLAPVDTNLQRDGDFAGSNDSSFAARLQLAEYTSPGADLAFEPDMSGCFAAPDAAGSSYAFRDEADRAELSTSAKRPLSLSSENGSAAEANGARTAFESNWQGGGFDCFAVAGGSGQAGGPSKRQRTEEPEPELEGISRRWMSTAAVDGPVRPDRAELLWDMKRENEKTQGREL